MNGHNCPAISKWGILTLLLQSKFNLYSTFHSGILAISELYCLNLKLEFLFITFKYFLGAMMSL